MAWLHITGQIRFDKPLILEPDLPSSPRAPIVLVHGSSGNQSEWEHALPSLDKTLSEYHPIYAFSLDLPYDEKTGEQVGGKSIWTTFGVKKLAKAHNWTIEKYADELAQRIDALQLKDVILIGHSMGGLVAAEYEQKHPQNVSKVIAFSSPFGGAPLLRYRLFQWLAPGKRHEQMRPGSEYLKNLQKRLHGNPKYLTIGSPHDWQVPNEYAKIPGVAHFMVEGYNHFTIVCAWRAWAECMEFVCKK